MTRYRLIDLAALNPQLLAWRDRMWAQRLINASNRNGRPSGLSPPPSQPISHPDQPGPAP